MSGLDLAVYEFFEPVARLIFFWVPRNFFHDPLVLLAAGTANPVAMLSLVARLRRDGSEHLRCALAMFAIALIPFSWLAIESMKATIGIGQLLWVAGLLLFLVPELVRYTRGGSRRLSVRAELHY